MKNTLLTLALCLLLLLSGCGRTPAAPVEDKPAEEAPSVQSNQIVLSCESADAVIDEAQFQYYFGFQYANVLETYGQSAFDPAQALEAQRFDDTQSWQDVLLTQALDHAEQTAQLCLAAKAADFSIPEAQSLQELEAALAQTAREQAYESPEAYLTAYYGEGATLSGYGEFLQSIALADAYSQHLLTAAVYTPEEVEAFYDSHAEDYAETFQLPKNDECRLDVRMIRFYPNDPSDPRDWSKAEARARKVISKLEDDPTDDAFATLAQLYTEDFKAPIGGLYRQLTPGLNSEALDTWLFPADAHRAPGDWELIREADVYTLCYVSAAEDTPYWRVVAEQDLRYADYMNALAALPEAYPFTRTPENVTLRVPTAHIAKDDIPDNVEAVG